MVNNPQLRRKVASKCNFHLAVVREALNFLEKNDSFKKETVIQKLNYGVIEDAIRWDYIREFIQAGLNGAECELLPVQPAFFDKKNKADVEKNPGKYIAGGYGKRTAGFASFDPKNQQIVQAYLNKRQRTIDGEITAHKRRAGEAKRLLAAPDEQAKIDKSKNNEDPDN